MPTISTKALTGLIRPSPSGKSRGTATAELNVEAIEIMWAMFIGENRRTVRNTLA